MPDEIKEEWSRFCAHWGCATCGFFLRSLLPVLKSWTDPSMPVAYPRWWAALLISGFISLVAGGINSNLPSKPRELVKSVGLGFALDGVRVLAKTSPF